MRFTGFLTLAISASLAVYPFVTIGRAARLANAQGTSQDASIEQELKEVDKRWLHAATVQDTAFLKEFFADGMFEIQRGGVLETGAGMRKAIGMPGRHVQIDIDDVVVRGIYGNTAVITDRTTQDGTAPDGRKVSGQYTVMRLLIKQNGRWRAIGAQMTPLRPSTSAPTVTGESRSEIKGSVVEKELIDLDHQWTDADASGNTDFLKRLFGDRMFEVQADGRVASASELLKEIEERKRAQLEGHSDEIQVQGIYGDIGILTERRVLKGRTANGQSIDSQRRATRVFVRQDGKWHAVASAETNIE